MRILGGAVVAAALVLVFGGVAERYLGQDPGGGKQSSLTQQGVRTITAMDALERALVDRMNRARTSRGLRKLSVAARLTSAATRHANNMASYGYFRHELWTPKLALDWTPFGRWIHWYYPGSGYSSWSAGENLAWGAPDITADTVIRRWLNSSVHRSVLFAAGWREVGVGAVHVTNPTGAFTSYAEVTIVVADFGRRS